MPNKMAIKIQLRFLRFVLFGIGEKFVFYTDHTQLVFVMQFSGNKIFYSLKISIEFLATQLILKRLENKTDIKK